MNKNLNIALAGVLLAHSLLQPHTALAQKDGAMSHFDVASVKLYTNRLTSDYGKCTGGPGTQSPTLWICNQTDNYNLIISAFSLELYQWVRPGWLDRTFLSVSARLPEGATKEQFHEMQRNLLVERFGLAWRWKESDGSVYRMVRDPGGVRLRESAPDAPAAVVTYDRPPSGTTSGADCYPVLPEGVSALIGYGNCNRWRSSNVTTEDIASVLRREFRTDVKDETGLTGHYDVDLKWETPPIEINPKMRPYQGPDAKTEFRNRLGLRLESTKGKIRNLIVDHFEKVPTAN